MALPPFCVARYFSYAPAENQVFFRQCRQLKIYQKTKNA